MHSPRTFPRIAVFTDLDGSLLDHADYSFDAARPALTRIREEGLPLVFTTSKTRAEVEHLQRQMGLREPFIVENGAALFFPDDYRPLRIDAGFRRAPYTVIQLGASYGTIRRFIYATRGQIRIRGFGDMSVREIAERTGLSAAQADLARQREFTEPFLPDPDTDIAALEKVATARGLKITRGGRFHHLIGIRQDKGAAVRIAAGIFSKNAGAPITTIGIGDSANDRSLLASVNIPVVIPQPDGTLLSIGRPEVRTAPAPGSKGWNAVVLGLLETLATRGD